MHHAQAMDIVHAAGGTAGPGFVDISNCTWTIKLQEAVNVLWWSNEIMGYPEFKIHYPRHGNHIKY